MNTQDNLQNFRPNVPIFNGIKNIPNGFDEAVIANHFSTIGYKAEEVKPQVNDSVVSIDKAELERLQNLAKIATDDRVIRSFMTPTHEQIPTSQPVQQLQPAPVQQNVNQPKNENWIDELLGINNNPATDTQVQQQSVEPVKQEPVQPTQNDNNQMSKIYEDFNVGVTKAILQHGLDRNDFTNFINSMSLDDIVAYYKATKQQQVQPEPVNLANQTAPQQVTLYRGVTGNNGRSNNIFGL